MPHQRPLSSPRRGARANARSAQVWNGCERVRYGPGVVVATFGLQTFAPLVGSIFRLDAGDFSAEVELAEAAATAPEGQLDERGRPFSLVFRGPSEPVLAQRIYAFEHDELGAFELFIVPIGRDESGTSYEAAFG